MWKENPYKHLLLCGLLFTAGSCSNGNRAVNELCATNTDCASEICHAGICASKSPLKQGMPCAGSGECRTFLCEKGVCQRGNRERGAECLYDDECASGLS